MIGLRAIASYVPDGFEENAGKMGQFNIDARFIADKIGVGHVARKGDDATPAASMAASIANIPARSSSLLGRDSTKWTRSVAMVQPNSTMTGPLRSKFDSISATKPF